MYQPKVELTKEQLKELFYIFYDEKEDVGDYENAKKPSDARKYEFKFRRNRIERVELFKSLDNDTGRWGKKYESTTYEFFKLYNNLDFVVGYKKKREYYGSLNVYVSQGYKTCKIKEVISKLREFGFNI